MRFFKIILLICIGLIFQACPVELEDDDIQLGTIVIENQLNESIYYCMNSSQSELTVREACYQSVLESSYILLKDNKKLKIFEGMFQNNQKLYIFIYKQSTLDTHSWEEIQLENLYDKRYSFTLEELKAMNWTIVYNGE